VNRFSSHVRSNVVGYLALFMALCGTAYAVDGPLAGQNTVGSGDIIDNDVRTADIRDANLTTQDIRADAVTTGKILDDTLTPADIAGVDDVLEAQTARLNDQPGGNTASQRLFSIGRVGLGAFCQFQNNGSLTGGINALVDGPGPIMVTDGEGAAEDFTVPLQPDSADFLAIINSAAGIEAQETSFAILDSAGASATGVAALSVNASTGDCVISVHAVG
jgi:hypothetical protein